VVLVIGAGSTNVRDSSRFHIPEPVTRGLLAAGRGPWFHRIESGFKPGNLGFLLPYFFAAIG